MVSAVYIESLQFSMIPLSIFAGVRLGVLIFRSSKHLSLLHKVSDGCLMMVCGSCVFYFAGRSLISFLK